jgi:hypothetical protein
MNHATIESAIETPNPIVNDNPKTLFSDSETVTLLRDFLASDKPEGTTPVDILQIVYLALRKAGDHSIFDAQQTIAKRLCVDVKTIARSQVRLAGPKMDWIARPRRRGRTSALSLKPENIPRNETKPLAITPDARELTTRYKRALVDKFRRKLPMKNWYSQQLPSAQNILNACNGDLTRARYIVGFALSHPTFKARAKKSLYHLFGIWKKVVKVCDEQTVTTQLKSGTAKHETMEDKQ